MGDEPLNTPNNAKKSSNYGFGSKLLASFGVFGG
jgi:hypothetical protein